MILLLGCNLWPRTLAETGPDGNCRPFFVTSFWLGGRHGADYNGAMFTRIPSILQTCAFSRLRFHLEFLEDAPGGAAILLRLRRDLRQAAGAILGRGERFTALFDPPLAADPVACRRFQRPGPPFVILPPTTLPQRFAAGEDFSLTIVFWGSGRQRVGDFIRALQSFGAIGLYRGEGRFELLAIEGEDAAGHFRPLWRPGQDPDRLSIPFHDLRWWLETTLPPALPLRLAIRTPARLITDGRPLFRGDFRHLFPFILRRTTSMLYAHCGVEAIDDPRQYVTRAAEVVELENSLAWRDWRVLHGEGKKQELGGLGGSLLLDGAALQDLAWILQLGTLMNLGKGAAFAAGSYVIE